MKMLNYTVCLLSNGVIFAAFAAIVYLYVLFVSFHACAVVFGATCCFLFVFLNAECLFIKLGM